MILFLLVVALVGACFGEKYNEDVVVLQELERSARFINLTSVNTTTTAFAVGSILFIGINAAVGLMHLASKGETASSKLDPFQGGKRIKREEEYSAPW